MILKSCNSAFTYKEVSTIAVGRPRRSAFEEHRDRSQGDPDESLADPIVEGEEGEGKEDPNQDHERVKLSVSFSPEVARVLRSLAAERGISMTEVLRQCITTEKFLADAIKNGEKILLKDPRSRTTRELVLR
jgi:hypothetical protein